jgi:hypothetical protein
MTRSAPLVLSILLIAHSAMAQNACSFLKGATKKANRGSPNKLIRKCETCRRQGKQGLLKKWCQGWLDIPCEATMLRCIHTPGTEEQNAIDAGSLYLLDSDKCVQDGGSDYVTRDLDWGDCFRTCRTSENCNSVVYEETCDRRSTGPGRCQNHCKMYEELPERSAFDTTSLNRWYVMAKKKSMTYPNGQKPECVRRV